jgi:phosphate starvation-inducible protein PhoH and related proteins
MVRPKRSTVKKSTPVKEKTDIPHKLSLIKPKTANQRFYVKEIMQNDVTICSGPSGTGKSLVALSTALDNVMRDDRPQGKIYITRPMIATSERDFPYIKGNLIEKLTPYFAPILANLEELIGSKWELEKMLENEIIVMQAIELMRGFTYKNCFVLITESQNMSISQAVMAITRLGENCKMIFEGDTDQKDLRGPDGLSFLREKLYECNDLCGMIEMGEEDILRHPLIGKILKQLDYKGRSAY